MDAGRMDKRISIEAQATTRNAIGEPVTAWAPLAAVWASIEPLRGREFWAQQQVQSEVTTRIRIRYRAGITPAHRVRHAGRIYNIHSVIDPKERHEELQLMCMEGPSNG